MSKLGIYKLGFLLCVCLVLGGCSQDFLDTVPRDFVPLSSLEEDLTGQKKKEEPEQKAKRDNGEEVSEARETFSEELSDEKGESSLLAKDAYEYAKQFLSEPEQLWYEDIRDAMGDFGEVVTLREQGLAAGLTEKHIDKIFQSVLNDHPEIFYVEGYSYTKYSKADTITAIEFSGAYSRTFEDAKQMQAEMDGVVEQLLSAAPDTADQYSLVKYVYDTIIRNTDYDMGAPDNQNIYSVFVNRRSVCQGYAKATQYLLNRLGIDCTLVLGVVESGEGHAWNLVQIDGSYYYLDTTWGDASYRLENTGSENRIFMPEINYDYLNVTTEELLKTHSLSEMVPMPACISLEANYYCKEGAYFGQYDKYGLETLVRKNTEKGNSDFSIKCATESCYREMLDRLIGNQEIFDFLGEAGSTIAYAQNDRQLSLTFWVTK